MPQSSPFVVTLDVGSSSVRTLLFDGAGAAQSGFGCHAGYQVHTQHDGCAEVDPAALLKLCFDCLSTLHHQLEAAGIRPAAVAFDTFWHSFLGVDALGNPVTPIIHLFDTRSTEEVVELRKAIDPDQVHARTGCLLHTSYWPAKLLWLSKHQPDAFRASKRWMSFGEYLFLKLFHAPADSTSMISGSGLWNQHENRYDEVVLSALPVKESQLPSVERMDAPQDRLLPIYGDLWPRFDGIPWFPALGDGACNNVGSGCATETEFALMVGTSGAMRAVVERPAIQIPSGLWCYRVDRKRLILGGALSNGGDVYSWMRRTLILPSQADEEVQLLRRKPGAHNLLMLPFFAGERSPYWRADLRAVIFGLDFSTEPMDILQAALESVALRFRQILCLMAESLGQPRHVVASGGALLASPAWTQMMADALGLPVVPCLEPEATSRGAALLALERLGVIPSIANVPARCGPPRPAVPENAEIYRELQASQTKLFHNIFFDK